MNKAYKFRIYPNAEQRELFQKTFGCVRFVYNKALAYKKEQYETNQKSMSWVDCVNYCNRQLKTEYDWLREPDNLALNNAVRNMDSAYQKFFREHTGYPRFKSKKRSKNSYTTTQVNNNIRIENGSIRLPKVGLVKMKKSRVIPEDYKLKSATVSQSASGKYYVSILFEFDSIIQPVEPKSFLGLDFSMHELYWDSEGREPLYPRYYRKAEQRLKREQRKLSLMQKGSKNWEKQRIRVAILHEKVANSRKDFLHKQSRQIANAYDCVCIENLNIKAMAQTLNFGKSVSDNGWGMFTSFLKYKLEEAGKQLVKVDKFFASSQLCSVCGYKNSEIKNLSVRTWDCPQCGTHHDRDVNAAINIRNEGMRLIALNQ